MKSDPIVVVGGGFGGLATVQALLAKSDGTSVILIDEGNRFLFKPLLYELLSGELQLWEVAPQYSDLASELGFIFLQECVVEIDEIEQKLITSSETEITYSQLVISTGVTTDYSLLENLQEYACGFSNLNDFRIIKKLITKINNSSEFTNPIVIAGAGPTGVELACKISDLIKDRIEIYLVDKGDKILPNCKSFNREKAIDAIAQRNIRVCLNFYIRSVDKTFLELSSTDNETNDFIKLDYSTLLWTAGLKPSKSKVVHHFSNENRKIKVNEFMQIDEYQNIFFVGDITFYENAPFPSSAQVAMQQGSLVAKNIISLREGNELKPFQFEELGEMLSLGIGNASITAYGITLAGPIAFEIRRFAYLMRMPGFLLSFKSSGAWIFSKKIINRLFSQSP
ncbi:NAD(P)/FAD-dependent oxidoreductase [Prochlorococcus sp. MIT 0916]|uniref:NAD(P)/FAD-dependent oxidoreductase n=1 Tax=Prochlorococcus sp. MIT 0916 TaxID=3082521 RepID=UPI0039B58F84